MVSVGVGMINFFLCRSTATWIPMLDRRLEAKWHRWSSSCRRRRVGVAGGETRGRGGGRTPQHPH